MWELPDPDSVIADLLSGTCVVTTSDPTAPNPVLMTVIHDIETLAAKGGTATAMQVLPINAGTQLGVECDLDGLGTDLYMVSTTISAQQLPAS